MPNAQRIIHIKNDTVATLAPEATVLEAAELMNERRIGSVVVMEKDRLVGIFTERDLMRRVVAEQRAPEQTKLADVMSSPVAVAAPHTRTDELRRVMREKRIRHIPVVDDEHVIGMVSIGDLNRVQHDVDVETISYLEQYISVT